MRLHTTTPDATPRPGYYAMPHCPHCDDTVVAPEMSKHVSERRIRHFWSCDTCGHRFETAVDLAGLRRQRKQQRI